MTFHHDQKFFDITDYIVFAITLLIPILIGMYYSFIAKNTPKTVSEYLVGNRNMGLFPVSMSLAASLISGYLVVGPISEVYLYGAQFSLTGIAITLKVFIFIIVYLPVFYNLRVTSTFEYLETRFDYKVRVLGSILFLTKVIINMAMWIYLPTLMFEQVANVNLNILLPIFSGICIFYTFGGVRGVIWADTFQMILMLLGLVVIVVVGVYEIGDVDKIWDISKQGNRLNVFDFNLDPRLRQSFWIFAIGAMVEGLANLTSCQLVVQRCVSLSTLFKSKVAMISHIVTGVVTLLLSCYIGVMLYAAFHDCDPISAKKITKPDQLLPYFIMNLNGRIPALLSVFISISFCAALSSVSSGLNSTSGIIFIDFIRPLSKKPITDVQGSFYMKIITVVIGIFYTAITFTLNNSKNIVQSTLSLTSIPLGPSFGIFTLGVLLPWANATGAFFGGIVGVAMVAWMSIGNLMTNRPAYSTLPLSIENCENTTAFNLVNETLKVPSKSDQDESFFLYAISFNYYALIGALTAIVVGMTVSYFTGHNKPQDMDPRLFSPLIRRFLKKEETSSETLNLATNQATERQ